MASRQRPSCSDWKSLCNERSSLVERRPFNGLRGLYWFLRVDVGGSHVSAALCALDDLRLSQLTSAPLAGVSSFEGFVDLVYLLGREVASTPGRLVGASFAVPGPFDCVAGISLMEHKLQWLYGKDLRRALAARFGWAPGRVAIFE